VVRLLLLPEVAEEYGVARDSDSGEKAFEGWAQRAITHWVRVLLSTWMMQAGISLVLTRDRQ